MGDWKEFQLEYFPTTLGAEFFDLMVGDLLGTGVDRTVFEYAPDKTCVVKFAHSRKSFQNAHEWDLWRQHWFAKTKLCTFLAPCILISHSGNVLVQKRTKPVPWKFKLPRRIPAVLSDLKRENWGIFQGRLVCHDYGRHDAVHVASKRDEFKVARWVGAKGGRFEPAFGADGATSLVI